MASSLINKFGKRAADNKFKVCTHVPNTKIKSLFHLTILQVSIQIKRLCNSQLNFGNESQTLFQNCTNITFLCLFLNYNVRIQIHVTKCQLVAVMPIFHSKAKPTVNFFDFLSRYLLSPVKIWECKSTFDIFKTTILLLQHN